MVADVRAGSSQRAVALKFNVSRATVQLWVQRALNKDLDQVDWDDGSHAPHLQPRETSVPVQQHILSERKTLQKESDLGEFGAEAIRNSLLRMEGANVEQVPSTATINRILRSHGVFDSRHRVRRPPPAPGWYLPEVAAGLADIDELDFVEGLFLEGGQELVVLNLISLHAGLCASWLNPNMRARFVLTCLEAHWGEHGLPLFAQFDNGLMFTGPRQFPDAIGTVIRRCLSLGVTPVFSVPNEFGIQSTIESYNNQWQQKVWQRFHFESQEQAQQASDRYVNAVQQKRAARHQAAPMRRAFPKDWLEPTELDRTGRIIFLRRTNGLGCVEVLKREFTADIDWCNRLVRCEIDLKLDKVSIFGLRRKDPTAQPLLAQYDYRLPERGTWQNFTAE